MNLTKGFDRFHAMCTGMVIVYAYKRDWEGVITTSIAFIISISVEYFIGKWRMKKAKKLNKT